jgi:hypothetical protein
MLWEDRVSEMQKELNRLLKARGLIDRALVAEAALEWLRSYGPKGPTGRDSIAGCVMSQNYAGSCPGAKEAREYLDEAIQRLFGVIGQRAIDLAEADIEAARAALPPSHSETP